MIKKDQVIVNSVSDYNGEGIPNLMMDPKTIGPLVIGFGVMREVLQTFILHTHTLEQLITYQVQY
ncbi:MAG: hypothetical protein ACLT39_02170 [Peptoniphilus sp.]